MQEKTLLNQANSTSNIHSGEVGSVSYDIFGSPYQKSGSFLADEQLATAKFFLGESINGTPINYDDINIYNYAPDAETLRKLAESTVNLSQ